MIQSRQVTDRHTPAARRIDMTTQGAFDNLITRLQRDAQEAWDALQAAEKAARDERVALRQQGWSAEQINDYQFENGTLGRLNVLGERMRATQRAVETATATRPLAADDNK